MRTSADFEIVSDPFRRWLEAETVCASTLSTGKGTLYTAYAKACVQANRAPMTKQMFGRLLRKYRPDLREFQQTVAGGKQWMYGGIGLRSETANPLDSGPQEWAI